MAKKIESCIRWRADGSCAEFQYTDEKGLIADLKKCTEKEADLIKREIKRGFIVKESESIKKK